MTRSKAQIQRRTPHPLTRPVQRIEALTGERAILPSGIPADKLGVHLPELEYLTTQAFRRGIETAQGYGLVQSALVEAVARIATASLCSNGRETRQVITDAVHGLARRMSEFETAVMILARDELLEPNTDAIADIVAYCQELRLAAKRYMLADDKSSRAALQDLRQCVADHDTRLADLLGKIGELGDRRGRPAELSPERRYLAERFIQMQKRVGGQSWRLGLRIVQEIQDRPEVERTPEESWTLDTLRTYCDPTGQAVTDKTGMRKYLNTLKAAYKSKNGYRK